MKNKILEIKNLSTVFYAKHSGQGKETKELIPGKAVSGVSFDVYEDEVLGIVGESGSGKSVTAYSILNLIPNPPGKIVSGEIIYRGIDLLKLSSEEIRKYRGAEISMIFQEPGTSLNPVMRIEEQMCEVFMSHGKTDRAEALKKSIELLKRAGLPDAEKRIKEYPSSLSGGMQQRVMIAMALAFRPSLLIADEPTTALDVTVQAQILDLMSDIKRENGKSSIIMITHNLGIIAEMCDRVLVMYGGKIQESANVKDLFENPLHPYTSAMIKSIPCFGKKHEGRLNTIPGMVPDIFNLPPGCKFCNRCEFKKDICEKKEPELKEISKEHFVRCHLYEG
ncbi:MAG: ABC transporter ATP-binding protein [Ignavibacteria bacterium]|nr:ABC transporter ATP-binding protein [Ignavibacteria bacterium]